MLLPWDGSKNQKGLLARELFEGCDTGHEELVKLVLKTGTGVFCSMQDPRDGCSHNSWKRLFLLFFVGSLVPHKISLYKEKNPKSPGLAVGLVVHGRISGARGPTSSTVDSCGS